MTQSVRKTPTDDLDFYPTQPWATRVLVEMVRPQGKIWEPACGGGHMAEVLRETNEVVSTDVHDYGYSRMLTTFDFLDPALLGAKDKMDWIITNPPFQRGMSERFAERAMDLAPNSAMLCRLSWLEGVRRCESLFSKRPPSRVIVLPERLGFHKGTCEVGRSGMLPYAWYVWEKDRWGDTTILEWAPSDSRSRYTKPGDVERYSRPVIDPAARTLPKKFDGDPEDWGSIHPKLMEWAKEEAQRMQQSIIDTVLGDSK